MSLTANGLVLRVKRAYRNPGWATAGSAAVAGIVIAFVGVVADAAANLVLDEYWTLKGSPGPVWIDPFWGTLALWLVGAVAVLGGATRLARYAAWGSLLAAAGPVAARYLAAQSRGGDDIISMHQVHYLAASLGFAILLNRPGRVGQAHVMLAGTRIAHIVAAIWGANVILCLALRMPLSPWPAASATGLLLLVALLQWDTLPRGAFLLSLTFMTMPAAGTGDLLGGAMPTGASAQVAAIVGIAASMAVLAYALIPLFERSRPISNFSAEHSSALVRAPIRLIFRGPLNG